MTLTVAPCAFAIVTRSGKLTLPNQVSVGDEPCHIGGYATSVWLAGANHSDGTMASVPVRSDGTHSEPVSLELHHGSSTNPQRQDGPHRLFFVPSNRFLRLAELGLDKNLVHKSDACGAPAPNDPPAPRAGSCRHAPGMGGYQQDSWARA